MASNLSFTTEAAADRARSILYDRARILMIAVGDWTDGAEPDSAWPAATQDAHTGRWLVQSARDYLADQFAAVGGVSAGVKPAKANLSGVTGLKGGGWTIDVATFFLAGREVQSAQALDVAFLGTGSPVVVGEIADHFDRKAVTRNSLVKGDDTAKMVAA